MPTHVNRRLVRPNAERIVQLRHQLALTAEVVAERAIIDKTTLDKIENGGLCYPRTLTYIRGVFVKAGLNVEMQDLIIQKPESLDCLATWLTNRAAKLEPQNEEISLERVLDDDRRLVDATLDRLLPSPTQLPVSIHRAMRHSTFAGGKRLRPILCMESARMVTGMLADGVAELAAAVELAHTYSLIHNDLPAVDSNGLRRGKPTCHVAFGEATAILAGDALLTRAFHLFADLKCPDREKLLIIKEVASALGTIDGMLGGEIMDMEATGPEASVSDLEPIYDAMTGALIAASLATGAIYAGASQEQVDLLRQFGRLIGRAFHIADSFLSVRDPNAESSDETVSWIDHASKEQARRAVQLVADACTELAPFGHRAKILSDLARLLVQGIE